MIIWSSILFSSPAWSTPQSDVRPHAETDAVPIAADVSIAGFSLPLRQLVLRSDPSPATASQVKRLRGQRYRAAALLPLQPVQGDLLTKTAETGSIPFSEATIAPAIDRAIESTVAQNPRLLSPQDDGTFQSQNGGNPPASAISDPELGVLRLQAPASPAATSAADTSGQMPTRCTSGAEPDPELGCLPLQPLPPPPPPRQPVVYLVGRLDYFRSSNVFSAIDPVNDGLIRPGLTLFAAPALGPDTYFIGSLDGNLIRYDKQSQIDYNELRFRAGIFQRLSPTMFGEVGWSNQQLFIAGSKIPGLPIGTRFLNDHAIRFELSRRDQFNNRLALNTFYQLRLSFADPDSRSRLLNSFIASLSYGIQPNLQVGIDYQFALANFTAIQREDQYHQLAARLTYTAFRNTQLNVFIGYSFGCSTDPTIDFNGLILGVSLAVNLGLF